ncbi:hypothetical protein pipiens_004055 [Culex pipiens pipiens]|uniref:Uncharacterized protein n=1 Tax=Culex pipiens pipiens TaxID=38569 RepID=A0ABD1CPU4_CULPP
MNSSRKRPSIYQETPQRFSESLIAELGHGRHTRYKDVSKDLNNLINKEEEDTPIATPPFNKDRLKLIVQRIIRQQFILKDEDGDPIKWVYDPNKNLEMCQKIAKAVQDKVRSYNYARYRIVSLCSIVEKDGQGFATR